MAIGKKITKIIFTTIIILALLIGAGIAFVVTTVDQNTIKEKAVKAVLDKTGRTLQINGNISWTFFPWLGVKMQDVSLSNPPNFKGENFAKAKDLEISIKLLPILSGNVEAGKIALTNLDLHLIKDKSGNTNWDFAKKTEQITQKTVTAEKSSAPTDLTIANLAIKNSNISCKNLQENKKIKIDNFNLNCKNINFKKPFAVKTSFSIKDLHPTFDAKINANTKINLSEDKVYKFKNLRLSGNLQNQNTKQSSNFNVNTDLVVDLNKDAFSTKNLDLQISGASAKGSLEGENILKEPAFSGKLVVDAPDLKELAKILELDKFTKNISNASLKANIDATPKLTKLSMIKASINDMNLNGNGSYSANNIDFNLSLNKLDLDFFDNKGKTKKATAKKQGGKNKSSSKPASSAQNKLKLNGKIKIAQIKVKDLKVDNFSTNITGTPDLINCQNISFDFYKGKGTGNTVINLKGKAPLFNIKMALKNTQIRPALIDLANYKNLSGNFSLNTNISMRGNSANALTRSLNGNGNVLVTHGSYMGTDVPYEVRRAHSMLNAKPMPPKTNPPRTDFDKLTMNFRINNGILNTKDFLVLATDYKVTGSGDANLVTQNLNMSLKAYSTNDKNFLVPITVTGPFSNPSVRPDAGVLLQDAVKGVIKGVGKDIIKKALPENIINIIPGGLFN